MTTRPPRAHLAAALARADALLPTLTGWERDALTTARNRITWALDEPEAPGTDLEPRPVCPSSPDHGRLVLRDRVGTPEQAWCGAWYDCADPRCSSSVLFPSPELRAEHLASSLALVDRLASEQLTLI